MTESAFNSEPNSPPELRKNALDPKGVLRKNLKPLLYLGAALLVILAAVFSSRGTKTPAQAAKNEPPQPMVQDNTDNNIQDLKNQLAAERKKQADQALATQAAASGSALPTPPQNTAAASLGLAGQPMTCVPGQPCPQVYPQSAGYSQANGGAEALSPEQQQAAQLAAKEREMAFDSRFASNLAYSQTIAQSASPQVKQSPTMPNGYAPQTARADQSSSSLIAPRAPGEKTVALKRAPEIDLDSAVGQPYVAYEGTMVDTVLMNRLDGDAAGPVKVLVSNPVYSHDRQHVLIPDGTIVLGEARKIGASGFGQQRRMAVVFHRMIMPDGYSVDLDRFQGLDQSGAEGLKDKANNHYFQIFGTSIALGLIAGAGEITQGGGTISTSGSQAFATGASANVSQSATTILDRFIQIPPTITIREGHRVKVYFTQDMLLPAYENHTIPQSF